MATTCNCCLGIYLSLPVLLLLMSCVDAAAFQYYQVPQQDQEYRLKNIQRLPSPDMLKALEYIENLRKQANRAESIPDYSSYQGAPFLSEQKDTSVQALSPESAKNPSVDDESQWVRAMLEALMQAEKQAKTTPQEKNKPYSSTMDKNFPVELSEDYESNKWPEKRPKNGKLPGGYYDDYSRDSPFKRTNEIVEGQYTPQSLATLQSVFQELGKLKGQANHKRDRLEEDQKLYKDDEDDMYKANNIAYEDVAGGEEWNPIEEKVESQTQEELKESKEEVENTDEMEEEMKRAGLLGLKDDDSEKDKEQESENLSKLMNFYLRMWVNRMEKGKQNAEKRSAKYAGKDLDPEAMYQLLDISRNLQIPPEDLIDMLRDGDGRKSGGRQELEKEAEVPEDLDEISDPTMDKMNIFKNKLGYMKQPASAVLPNIPEDLTVEDMINLIGADKLPNQKPAFLNQLNQNNGLPRSRYMLSKSNGHKAAWLNDLEKRQMEYEPRSMKEEDLAEYVAKTLAKYPDLLASNQNKRVAALFPPDNSQEIDKQYEQAVKEYLNLGGLQDLETLATASRRLPVTRESDDTQSRQYADEDMLMKVLEYLNQEKADRARDHNVKRSMENM